ncbi:MAG TPA: glycosyltransferase, partial [Caldilineaceae bacterium]|nr:glycosyltransferase [Caldilineaceae bacterium]
MTRTVIHFTDSADFGGAEQSLLHLLAGLDRQQWRPVLFHHAEPGLEPLLAGARALGVALQIVPRMPLGRQGALLSLQFARRLRSWQPAVFHAHLTWPLACKYGLVGAMLAHVPAIVATAQLFVELPYTYATRCQQRLLATGVGRYLAVSQAVAQRLQERFWIPQRRIHVIPNAIPVESFQPRSNPLPPALRQGAKGQPIILTVARLDKQKGHSDLLKAAVQVPEASFVLVGDGPERAQLEEQSRTLGLERRVCFLGYRQDIPALLADCDLFVLPSRYEGLPLAVLEAMAAGKPVIASAIPGTREAVVDGESGVLVPPADPAALAAAIRQLLADPAQAQRLACAGRVRVQQEFSVEVMVRR